MGIGVGVALGKIVPWGGNEGVGDVGKEGARDGEGEAIWSGGALVAAAVAVGETDGVGAFVGEADGVGSLEQAATRPKVSNTSNITALDSMVRVPYSTNLVRVPPVMGLLRHGAGDYVGVMPVLGQR